MKKSVVLSTVHRPKRYFDLKNKVDMKMYKYFLANARWGGNGCPFILEYPYLSIPDMIKDKIVHNCMGVEKMSR